MSVEYGNLSSFPSHSFDFPKLLIRQGVYSMVSDYGNYYPDLVKDFYAILVIISSVKDVLTSRVKNIDIVLDLEAFGNYMGISYKGQAFHHGFTPEWEGYSKMDDFVSHMSCLTASYHGLLENLTKSQNPEISDEEESEEDNEDMGTSEID
ncbi:hypothetical protein KIW84_022236 [Lathyrus oleraceus]|uniref:Uncharacterized protein n=1 Tax=Pisum sativum TaxID=3888 RepID=A0A9D5B519_PEA|nr:hypothetical protein KIW84_022236 [Pisum sativum]